MHSRLLSFLSDFERALLADDPSPEDGSWQTERAVNYQTGLARAQLCVKLPDGSRKLRGAVLVQGYKLADGTGCLKAHLSWTGSEATTVHSIFSKPGCNWKSEARRLAATWMGGAPVSASVTPIAAEAAPAEQSAVAAM